MTLTALDLFATGALGICLGFFLGCALACTLIRWDDTTPIGRK